MKVLTTNELNFISGGLMEAEWEAECPGNTVPGNTSDGTAATVVATQPTTTTKIDINLTILTIGFTFNSGSNTTTLNCVEQSAGTYSSWCSYNSSLMDRTGLTEGDLLSAF